MINWQQIMHLWNKILILKLANKLYRFLLRTSGMSTQKTDYCSSLAAKIYWVPVDSKITKFDTKFYSWQQCHISWHCWIAAVIRAVIMTIAAVKQKYTVTRSPIVFSVSCIRLNFSFTMVQNDVIFVCLLFNTILKTIYLNVFSYS